MGNKDVKQTILDKGSEIIHKKGYNSTSINEICSAANIPKGSFYYYFGNKDDFAVHLIDFFLGFMLSVQEKYLNNKQLSYIDRLRGFFKEFNAYFETKGCSGGCPIGNLAQELSDSNEPLREKLDDTLERTRDNISILLQEAQENNEISQNFDLG